MEETLVRHKKAGQLHLELMREDGAEIPEAFASGFSLDVQIVVDSPGDLP